MYSNWKPKSINLPLQVQFVSQRVAFAISLRLRWPCSWYLGTVYVLVLIIMYTEYIACKVCHMHAHARYICCMCARTYGRTAPECRSRDRNLKMIKSILHSEFRIRIRFFRLIKCLISWSFAWNGGGIGNAFNFLCKIGNAITTNFLFNLIQAFPNTCLGNAHIEQAFP